MLSSGTKLGPYEILAPLGAGGMGEVYRARDTRLGREVAVKVLPQHLMESAEAKQRFEREARAVSSLNHAHICTLYDIGHQDGVDFLVMEFLEGETLAARIHHGPLSVRESANIALQVARGLGEAHLHGVIHRDIKPSNIILTKSGTVKIIDFGLARMAAAAFTQTHSTTTGTIGYMSPEQTRAMKLDARTDVWSLGVVLAESLTGKNPFQRESASAILLAILNEPPTAMPNVPLELQRIIYRALAKNPEARYADCRPMADDLELFLSTSAAEISRQPVDLSAPTVTLRPAQIQEYISQASGGVWTTGGSGPKRRWSRWWLATLVLPVAAAVIFAVPALRTRIVTPFFGAPQQHIAVLPFDNLGNNPANAPLAEGLMDSLSGALSNLDVGSQSLWVVPASVVRARKVTDPSAAERQLGANLVVEGSIEREGQDVHLNVALVDTKSLRQLGSVQLEDRAGDLATLQDEAVSRLAKLMGISVTADMLKNTGGKVNPAAYQLYLTALGYIQRYDKPGNLDLAITALNNAVKQDPNFALGYAELGEAYRLKYAVSKDQQAINEATAYCTKAIQLNDHLPAAYVTLGKVHDASGQHNLAVQEFQHALQLDAHDADAVSGMARAYENAGRLRDAEVAYKKAAALHPDFWAGYDDLGIFYTRHARFPDAIAQFQQAIQLTPDNSDVYLNLAAVYLNMGDSKLIPDAEQALKKSIELTPSYPAYANLGVLYLSEKRYKDAADATEKALQLNDKDFRVWSNLDLAYKWLGNDSQSKAAREHELALVEEQVKSHPQDAIMQSELADLYAEQKTKDKALLRIQSALALAPEDAQVLANVAGAYESLGDRTRAIRYAQEALRKGYSLDDFKADPYMQGLLADSNFRPNGKLLKKRKELHDGTTSTSANDYSQSDD